MYRYDKSDWLRNSFKINSFYVFIYYASYIFYFTHEKGNHIISYHYETKKKKEKKCIWIKEECEIKFPKNCGSCLHMSFRLRGLDSEFLKSISYYITTPNSPLISLKTPLSFFMFSLSILGNKKKSHFYVYNRRNNLPTHGLSQSWFVRMHRLWEFFLHVLGFDSLSGKYPKVSGSCDWCGRASSPEGWVAQWPDCRAIPSFQKKKKKGEINY